MLILKLWLSVYEPLLTFKVFNLIIKSNTVETMTALFQYSHTLQTLDRDQDGRVSAAEIYESLQEMGAPITMCQAQEVVAKLDRNGDRRIDLDGQELTDCRTDWLIDWLNFIWCDSFSNDTNEFLSTSIDWLIDLSVVTNCRIHQLHGHRMLTA